MMKNLPIPQSVSKKQLILSLVFAAIVSSAWSADFVPGRVLIKAADSADEATVQAQIQSRGAREIGRIHQINVRILQVPAKSEARVVAALSNNPNFEFAEPDFIATANLVPNDPL